MLVLNALKGPAEFRDYLHEGMVRNDRLGHKHLSPTDGVHKPPTNESAKGTCIASSEAEVGSTFTLEDEKCVS